MKTDREALEAIRDYPLTNIQDGDMLDALEAIQAIAAAQLEGDDWSVDDKPSTHYKDSHCSVDMATMLCIVCGAYHGDACPQCDGCAYHDEDCPTLETNSSDDID